MFFFLPLFANAVKMISTQNIRPNSLKILSQKKSVDLNIVYFSSQRSENPSIHIYATEFSLSQIITCWFSLYITYFSFL